MRITLYQIIATKRSSPPDTPLYDEVYLDDGTNTVSGIPGFRHWNGTTWNDIGMQEIGDIAIDGGGFTG